MRGENKNIKEVRQTKSTVVKSTEGAEEKCNRDTNTQTPKQRHKKRRINEDKESEGR